MRITLIFFFLFLSCLAPLQATTVRPLALPELVQSSAVIIQARCIGLESKIDPLTGWQVTYTDFVVVDPIKGAVSERHTIKQIGGHNASTGLTWRAIGIPQFKLDQAYIIFLAKPSSLGFSSPMGLQQGRFSIIFQKNQLYVSNGRSISTLFKNIPQSLITELKLKQVKGQAALIKLDSFKSVIKALLKGHQS